MSAVNVQATANDECHMLKLVEDCFYEVFKYLPIIDWCALRDTCSRLRQITDLCYEKEFKNFQFNGEFLLRERYAELTLLHARTFFRSFGHLQPNAVIHADCFAPDECRSDELVKLMNDHCSALKDLKLIKIDVSAIQIEASGRLFAALHRLVIDKCLDDNRTLSTCLMHCKDLTELELIRLFNIEGNSLAQAFPKLESFSIKSCDNFNFEFLQEFISQNPQLKKLKLIGCNFITEQVFQKIADHMPNLESLSMRMVHVAAMNELPDHMMHLLKLTKLTKLDINCGGVSVNAFLSGLVANNTLDSLHLSSAEINKETVQILCNLKTLKVLKFTATPQLDKDVCKSLAASLPLLNEVHILECATTTVDELLEFVEHSKGLSKLVYLQESEDPSMSKQQFLNLVEKRQRRANNRTLSVFLDYFDHRNIKDQLMWEGVLGILEEHKKTVKLLPIDDEDDKSTAFDYGCGNGHKTRLVYDDVYEPFGFHDDDDDDYDEFESLDDFDDYDEDDEDNDYMF